MRADNIQLVLYDFPDIKEAEEAAKILNKRLVVYLCEGYTNYETLVSQIVPEEVEELLNDVTQRIAARIDKIRWTT